MSSEGKGSLMKAVALCLAVCCVSIVSVAEEQWTDLFNGKDLDGWEKKGGTATYRVEDGAIVGVSAPNSENTFLCTKKHYGDFILEFEFISHPELNSGVQVRSESLPEYKDGRVHGYQVELEQDDRDRDWNGGIYDESRRGWLFPKEQGDEALAKIFGEQGKRIWKEGEWNKVRVEAKGDHLQTWVNGEKRADLHDDMTLSGFIALQVHGVGAKPLSCAKDEPMTVRWRNIRIQEIAPDAEKK